MISTIGKSTGTASLEESCANGSRGEGFGRVARAAAMATAEPEYGAERGLARVPGYDAVSLGSGELYARMQLNMGGTRWLIRNMSG